MSTPRRWRLSLLALLAIAACNRGPDVEMLQAALQSHLDEGFEARLFTVSQFHRKGSAPFTDLERGVSGLFVYYDAELRFERDYDLTSWRGLNLGTLSFVAGANEEGIRGLRPEGNRAGDLLHVHGRMSYVREDGEWSTVQRAPPESAPVPELGRSVEGLGPEAVLAHVRSLIARNPSLPRGSHDAAIVGRLREALLRVDLFLAREEGRHTLGGGQRLGTYREFSSAFAMFATTQGLPFHAHPSEGSVENGVMLQRRELDFALLQSDVAETLHEGWADASQPALPDLRSVASLWPEAVHILTLEHTGIERIDQLPGRRIAIGSLRSGNRLTALRISLAAGMQRESFPDVRLEGMEQSIADLEAGTLDAVVVIEAIPSRPLQGLTRRRPDVRFVSIPAELLQELAEEHFAYYPITVPARTYPGQTEAYPTLGLAAALFTHVDTPDDLVQRVCETLLGGAGELAQTFYRAGFISRETAGLGIAVPLHPGAERFYRESNAPTEGNP